MAVRKRERERERERQWEREREGERERLWVQYNRKCKVNNVHPNMKSFNAVYLPVRDLVTAKPKKL